MYSHDVSKKLLPVISNKSVKKYHEQSNSRIMEDSVSKFFKFRL